MSTIGSNISPSPSPPFVTEQHWGVGMFPSNMCKSHSHAGARSGVPRGWSGVGGVGRQAEDGKKY